MSPTGSRSPALPCGQRIPEGPRDVAQTSQASSLARGLSAWPVPLRDCPRVHRPSRVSCAWGRGQTPAWTGLWTSWRTASPGLRSAFFSQEAWRAWCRPQQADLGTQHRSSPPGVRAQAGGQGRGELLQGACHWPFSPWFPAGRTVLSLA